MCMDKGGPLFVQVRPSPSAPSLEIQMFLFFGQLITLYVVNCHTKDFTGPRNSNVNARQMRLCFKTCYFRSLLGFSDWPSLGLPLG